MSEMEPCPFCGADAVAEKVWGVESYLAHCARDRLCGSVVSDSMAAAIRKWNARVLQQSDSTASIVEECARIAENHADQCDDTALGRRTNQTARDIAAAIRDHLPPSTLKDRGR